MKTACDLIKVHTENSRILFEPQYLNFRSYNENLIERRFGKYFEWLVTSIFITCDKGGDFVISTYEQNVKEHWDFQYKGVKFDLTMNPNSKPYSGVLTLYVDQEDLFDANNFLKFNFVLMFYNRYALANRIELDIEKVNKCNSIINSLISLFMHFTKYDHVSLRDRIVSEAAIIIDLLKQSKGITSVTIYDTGKVEFNKG